MGTLGAGKTTFAQGLALGLGIAEQVISPTFVLVREYERPDGCRLIHMDLYRVRGGPEALDLGLDDYLAGDDIVVVEWPENAEGAFPAEPVTVTLEFADEPPGKADGRRVTIEAFGEELESVVQRLQPGGGHRW
jgi:tRNA threonylcarbamoyladenosine biosynthesis protein TsaE